MKLQPTLFSGESPLLIVNEVKFLDQIFDPKRIWVPHIKQVKREFMRPCQVHLRYNQESSELNITFKVLSQYTRWFQARRRRRLCCCDPRWGCTGQSSIHSPTFHSSAAVERSKQAHCNILKVSVSDRYRWQVEFTTSHEIQNWLASQSALEKITRHQWKWVTSPKGHKQQLFS